MTDLTNRWYQNVRVSPINSDDEEEDADEIVEFSAVPETRLIQDDSNNTMIHMTS